LLKDAAMTAKPARQPALGFIFVTLVLIVLGFGILIPVLPGLVTQFKGNDVAEGSHSYGWLLGVFALMQFISAPILGSLSDRFGRRRVLLIALAGTAIDYVIMWWAPSIGWLFVGRVISGLTAGALSTINAYVADVTPPEKRAQAYGFIGAAFGLGFVIGPLIGGVLGDGDHLRRPFWVAAVVVGLNWLYGAFFLPESLPVANRRAFAWKRANPVGSLLALRRYPAVLGLTGSYFLNWLAQIMLQSIWVLYTGYRYHWGPKEVGYSLAFVGVASAIVQGALVKPILGRIGERRGLALGLIFATLAYTGYGLASQGWMLYAIIWIGVLAGLAGPSIQSLITRHVPPNEQGSIQGALTGLSSAAGFISPPIAAWSFGWAIPVLPGLPFFEAALLMLLALVVALASFRADDRAAHAGEVGRSLD
jgi:MFS transporter, DHA1 family, tetracycline resistance protein